MGEMTISNANFAFIGVQMVCICFFLLLVFLERKLMEKLMRHFVKLIDPKWNPSGFSFMAVVFIEAQGVKKYLLEESYKEEEKAQASSSFFQNFLIIGMALGDQRLRWIGIDAKSDKVQHVDQLGKEPSFFIKPENSSNEKWWSAVDSSFL